MALVALFSSSPLEVREHARFTSSLELPALTSTIRARTSRGRLGALVTSKSSHSSIVKVGHQNNDLVEDLSLGGRLLLAHIRG